MIDIYMRKIKDAVVAPLTRVLERQTFSPNYITIASGIVGLIGIFFSAMGQRYVAFPFCLFGRILDGLDGAGQVLLLPVIQRHLEDAFDTRGADNARHAHRHVAVVTVLAVQGGTNRVDGVFIEEDRARNGDGRLADASARPAL